MNTASYRAKTYIYRDSDEFQTEEDPRIADIDLGYYDFPDECQHCGSESVYPMGATDCLTGNIRECFNCDEVWVEG